MEPLLPPDLVLRRDALHGGWSDEELTARLRRGELTRLRPGAYLTDPSSLDAVARHRHLVVATVAALRRPAVVSHQSAAVLWGLPLWGVPLGRVHVTRRPPASSEVGRYLRCHVARLPDDEVTTVDGVVVATPARTALDLARTLPAEAAVVVLDAALGLGLVQRADLVARLARIGHVPAADVRHGRSGSPTPAARAWARAGAASSCTGSACRRRPCSSRSGRPAGGSSAGPTSPGRRSGSWASSTVG
ncbi:type IV toxin-antitoxin system AbiEi family antitoxin domain-containing protein [Geodermatophilus sp. SYSU D00710]